MLFSFALVLTLGCAEPDGSSAQADAAPPADSPRAATAADLVSMAPTVDVDGLANACRGDYTAIATIQGRSKKSPREGERVTTQGIVTAVFAGRERLEGFFLQALEPDDDARTSEGLFVHTPRDPAPAPGDVLRLSGEVVEFHGLTELTRTRDRVSCGRAEVPPPVRMTMPIADDALEALEGMWVTVPEALTVADLGDLGRYGTLTLSSGGRLVAPTNGTSSAGERGRTILVDDASSEEDPRPVPFVSDGRVPRAGDTVRELTGILSFSHETYRFLPTETPSFTSTNPRLAAPPAVGGAVRVAAFNVLNYFTTLGKRGADNREEQRTQRAKLVATLAALDADVVGLIELESNGDRAQNDLLEALNGAVGADTYRGITAPRRAFGDDPIRVGLIYKQAAVTPVGDAVLDRAPVFKRPPMAQTFQAAGETFTVAVAHLKSKGCRDASGPDRDQQDGQGCYNDMRTRQAHRLADFVGQLASESGDEDVLLLGDLNAYAAEDPIRALREAGLVDVIARHVPEERRYTFVYRGQAGQLDHALATQTAAAKITGADIWHVNADEARVLDYQARNPRSLVRQNSAQRASDHDPILVGFGG